MTKTEGQETCKLRVTVEAQMPSANPQQRLASPPPIYLPPDETIPPAISIIAQIRHFRAPPALG